MPRQTYLYKTLKEKQQITQSLTMWQWKQQSRAKFGADDVTRPSKRFAFDGLKLSCKKKTSS